MTLFAWRLTPTFHILLIWCCKAPCFHSKEKCPCSHFASWSLEAIGHESIGAKARHAIRNAATWQHLSVYGMQSRHVETVETIRHYHCELTSCTKADTAMRADAIRLDRVQVFWDVSASVLLSESGLVLVEFLCRSYQAGAWWAIFGSTTAPLQETFKHLEKPVNQNSHELHGINYFFETISYNANLSHIQCIH